MLSRSLPSLLISLLFHQLVFAQQLTLNDSIYTTSSINKYIQYFEDLHEKAEVFDFLSNPENFNFKSRRSQNFSFYKGAIWLKLNLKNCSDVEDWHLEIAHPTLDSVDLYLIAGNKIVTQYQTGDDFSFAHRPVEHRYFLFPLKLQSDSNYTCLIRVRSDKSLLRIPVHLQPQKNLISTVSYYNLLIGIYFGFLIAATFYGIITFIMVGYKANLYYSIYVFTGLIFFSTQTGHFYQYIIPNNSILINIIPATAISLIMLFTALFMIDLLHLKKHSTVWYRIHVGIVVLSILCILYQFVDPGLVIAIVSYLTLGVFTVFVITSVVLWVRRVPLANYLALSWGFYVFGVVIHTLRNDGLIPESLLNNNGLFVGTIIEIFMLTIALSINQRQMLRDFERSKQNEKIKALELENERMHGRQLELEKDMINRQLISASLENQQQDVLIKSLGDLDSEDQLRSKVNKLLTSRRAQVNSWENFKSIFEEVHPDFLRRLHDTYPDLSTNDLRQLAFIRMNLKIKEIAIQTGVSVDAVKKARLRIKQKIGTDQDLSDFLASFSS